MNNVYVDWYQIDNDDDKSIIKRFKSVKKKLLMFVILIYDIDDNNGKIMEEAIKN